MAPIIYALCAVTSLVCAWLLLRAYSLRGYKLLLWSGLCFGGLTLNNILLMLDKIVFPNTDLLTLRLIVALVALLPLLYGLVFEE